MKQVHLVFAGCAALIAGGAASFYFLRSDQPAKEIASGTREHDERAASRAPATLERPAAGALPADHQPSVKIDPDVTAAVSESGVPTAEELLRARLRAIELEYAALDFASRAEKRRTLVQLLEKERAALAEGRDGELTSDQRADLELAIEWLAEHGGG